MTSLITDQELIDLRSQVIANHAYLTDWEIRFVHDTETRPAMVWTDKMIDKLRTIIQDSTRRRESGK